VSPCTKKNRVTMHQGEPWHHAPRRTVSLGMKENHVARFSYTTGTFQRVGA
jgi:hypothetical protein